MIEQNSKLYTCLRSPQLSEAALLPYNPLTGKLKSSRSKSKQKNRVNYFNIGSETRHTNNMRLCDVYLFGHLKLKTIDRNKKLLCGSSGKM